MKKLPAQWWNMTVPRTPSESDVQIWKLDIPLFPAHPSGVKKHVELVPQEEDIIVSIDRSCIFLPDIWGHSGTLVCSPQPEGAHCPCCGKTQSAEEEDSPVGFSLSLKERPRPE